MRVGAGQCSGNVEGGGRIAGQAGSIWGKWNHENVGLQSPVRRTRPGDVSDCEVCLSRDQTQGVALESSIPCRD